jgi:hypothetical protein
LLGVRRVGHGFALRALQCEFESGFDRADELP